MLQKDRGLMRHQSIGKDAGPHAAAGEMGSGENGPQTLQTGNFPSVLPGERDTVAMFPHLN